MKPYILVFGILLIFFCNQHQLGGQPNQQSKTRKSKEGTGKIQVLNFGTFHMASTPDAHSTEFDSRKKENQQKVHAVARKLSAFDPTVILVETVPEKNKKLQNKYKSYLENPDLDFEEPSEVELLAFELGRLSGVQRIYGIDHKMGYNYRIGQQIVNTVDSVWHDRYYQNPLKFYPEVHVDEDTLNLLQKLKLTNNDRYLDFLIAVNADMLTHAGTEKGFEGADEAAKYYQRNLRMFSNLHRIDLQPADRVFILMGASHTAFFRDFLSRDPKYDMVNTYDYLK
ncbi:MAG: hypothetical protein GF313_05635 [Caldithrix sp.]|nr:hypothetical protein [Caldithrix sp.]